MRLGLDLVLVERVAAMVSASPDGGEQLFAEPELAVARAMEGRRREQFLAGRFAVKEAFCKAVGGPAGIDPRDVACVRQTTGEPRLELGDTALAAMAREGCVQAAVRISHDAGLATAAVLAW